MTFLLLSDNNISNIDEFHWLFIELLTSMGHQIVCSEEFYFDAIIYYGNNYYNNNLLDNLCNTLPVLIIPLGKINSIFDVKMVNSNFGNIIIDSGLDANNIYKNIKGITKLSFDLVYFLFYYLAEEEYKYNKSRDKYERLTFEISKKKRIELENPIVSMWGLWIDNWLSNQSIKYNTPFYKKCIWPHQAKIAISFSHDVDIVNKNFYRYWRTFIYYLLNKETSISNFLYSILKDIYSKVVKGKSIYNNYQFSRIRSFHKTNNIKATFNIISSNSGVLDNENYIEKAKDDILKLIEDKHEIGLHGGYESKSYLNEKIFIAEKKLLQKIIGNKVISNRQHYLGFKFDKTFLIHEKAQIKSDSSTAYPDQAGFKSGFASPYQPWTFKESRKVNIYELPLILMDGTLLSKAYSNTRIDNAKTKFIDFFNIIESFNGVLTINWHQRIFSEGPYKKWMQLYYFIVEYINQRNVYVATQKNIIKRYKEIKSINIILKDNLLILTTPTQINSFSFIINYPYKLKTSKRSDILIRKKEGYYMVEINEMKANEEIILQIENETLESEAAK